MATFLPSFAIFNFGGMELLLILFIVLLLFGAKRLPELAKGLGQSVKEFKKASQEDEAKPAATEAAKPAETRKTGNGGSAPGAN